MLGGRALVALAIAGVLALVYFPIVIGQVMFFRDPANWTYPARFFARATLLAGELPTWNPLLGLGFPTLGNPLYGLFYPPNWLFLPTPERLVVHMVTWQSLGHLIWGGLGMAALLLRLLPGEDRQQAGSAASGRVRGGDGLLPVRLPQRTVDGGVAAASGCLGALVRPGRGGPGPQQPATPGWSARAGAVLAGAAPLAAAFLLGEIFIAAMGAMFAAITAAVDRWSARANAGSNAAPADRGLAPLRWRPLLACAAAALALAGAVALVVVLPAARAAAGTDRGRPLARAFAETASLHPIRLVELVAPQAMGVPYEHYPGGRWLNEADLDGTPLSYSMYLGASVFALAALAFGRGRRLALGLAVAAGFFLIVALGKHTPVHHGWRSVLRLMAYMRYPEKYMVLVTAWLSLLAGLGAARLLAGEVRVRRVLAVAGVLVAVVLAAGLYPAELAPYVRKGGLTGLGAVLGIAVALYLRPRRPLAAALLLPAVVVGDLAAAAVPMQHFGPARIATNVPDVVRAIQDQNRNIVPPPRAHRTRAAEFSVARRYRVTSYAAGQMRAMQVLVENASNSFGIALVPGYDAALPSAAMNAWAAGLRHGPGAMRLFAVPYAVFPEPGAPRSRPWQQALVPVMDPAPGARLYRLRDPLPRLYLTGRAELRPDPLRGSMDPAGWDPLFAPAVLDGSLAYLSPEPGVAGLEGPPGRAGICRFDLFQAHRIEATCRADREALAVFVEQHDPGWSAQVDGRAVPLLRANALFRAVRLAPGEHSIRLSFHPPGLAAGGAAALAALLAGLGLLVVWLRGRRGDTTPR